jgi:hypothetical protein
MSDDKIAVLSQGNELSVSQLLALLSADQDTISNMLVITETKDNGIITVSHTTMNIFEVTVFSAVLQEDVMHRLAVAKGRG